MPDLAWLACSLLACWVAGCVGYWLRAVKARREREDIVDRYERITGEPSRRGEAHNWTLDSSATVRKGHMRNRRRWNVQ